MKSRLHRRWPLYYGRRRLNMSSPQWVRFQRVFVRCLEQEEHKLWILSVQVTLDHALKCPTACILQSTARGKKEREGEMLCVEYILELATERRLHLTAQTTWESTSTSLLLSRWKFSSAAQLMFVTLVCAKVSCLERSGMQMATSTAHWINVLQSWHTHGSTLYKVDVMRLWEHSGNCLLTREVRFVFDSSRAINFTALG